MSDFTHLNDQGQAHMVDVSAKATSHRMAKAQAIVILNHEVLRRIRDDDIGKGDLLATARVAGIQASKKCAELIPLCHPLPLSKVEINIEEHQSSAGVGLRITALCKTTAQTGVEMEALTAASVAALTVYDMCKSIDKGFSIQELRLLTKTGGKSGNWELSANQAETAA